MIGLTRSVPRRVEKSHAPLAKLAVVAVCIHTNKAKEEILLLIVLACTRNRSKKSRGRPLVILEMTTAVGSPAPVGAVTLNL